MTRDRRQRNHPCTANRRRRASRRPGGHPRKTQDPRRSRSTTRSRGVGQRPPPSQTPPRSKPQAETRPPRSPTPPLDSHRPPPSLTPPWRRTLGDVRSPIEAVQDQNQRSRPVSDSRAEKTSSRVPSPYDSLPLWPPEESRPPDLPSSPELQEPVHYPASPCSPSASLTEEVELAEEAERVLCPSPISDLSISLSSTNSYESTASVEVLPTKPSTTRKWPYWMKSLAAS